MPLAETASIFCETLVVEEGLSRLQGDERLALLDPETRELIEATERFHARLKRIDASWRERDPEAPSAVAALRERLARVARG